MIPVHRCIAVVVGVFLLIPAISTDISASDPIMPGQFVFIKVQRHPELSSSVQVDESGNVSLPYIGNVTVGNLSESDASARVSSAYGVILKNPRVTVTRSAGTLEPQSARTAQMTTQVVHLENSSSDVLQKALTGMSSLGGSVSSDADSNTLIVTDTPDVVQNILAAVRELDQMQSQITQVNIEAKIAEVTSEAAKEIGIRWAAVGDHLTGGYIPGARQDARVNGIRTFNDPAYNERLGDSTNRANSGGGRRFMDEGNWDRRLQVPLQLAAPGQMYFGFVNTGIDLLAMMDALVADNKAQMLATPYIRTVNHKTAHIKMTQEYPYTEMGTAGINTVSSTRFLDIGILLDVTPHVRKDPSGVTYVQLDLKPEVSTATGVANGVPIRSVRSSSSIANVRDGQTLVIGGIVQRDARDVIQKVPGLGSVPVLGMLFRHKEKSKGNSELMIFVTPKVYERPESVINERSIDLTQLETSDSQNTPEQPKEKRKE
ncbi:MAG TPA: polysaccharide biosynthesis/export family protein [Candidatus Hydrogenedentes bacterium]|nr:polysaccharide biosynthesis/export family protein [Candidatus Hydrogenedentota bacterium]